MFLFLPCRPADVPGSVEVSKDTTQVTIVRTLDDLMVAIRRPEPFFILPGALR